MENKKENRIVVTGATGMVGSHIVSYLLKCGYKNILALKRSSSAMQLVSSFQDKIEWIPGDITDTTSLDFLQEGDIVIHAAAMVSYQKGVRDEMNRINIQGTSNLINEALHAGVEKFIHISSVAALGKKFNGELTTENHNYDKNAGNSPYSVSKYAAERQVWRGQLEGLNTVILNPSVVLGAGYWDKSSSAIVHRTAEGLPFYPRGSAGFVDVRDIAKACKICIETPVSNERIILNGFNISYQEFFTILTDKLKVKMPNRSLPDWLGGLFWRWELLKSQFSSHPPVVTKDVVLTSRKQLGYDNSKSKELLQLKYIPIDKTFADIATAFLKSREEVKGYALLEL